MAKKNKANKENIVKQTNKKGSNNPKRAQQEVHASNSNTGVNIRGGKKAAMNQNNKTSNNEFNTNFQPKVGSNDPSWYNLTPSMVATGANISYNTALGVEQPLNIVAGGGTPTAPVQHSNYRTNLPGIMTVDMMPTAGTATGPASAINLAGRSVFATIRRNVNGARSYEYTDVMNYILTVGSMYSYVAFIMRTLSATRTLSLLNRYSRENLIEAMGFMPRDIIDNSANYLFRLNTIIKQLNLLPIPKNIQLFDRWVWLNTNIFLDEEGPKAQLYIPQVRY
uniref:Capsid protein n=1 Tax=Hilary virus TaxID=2707225 RepID=A0A6H0DIA8_9VIRU|nr:MAG: capsid protein [Hilary virus]